jgi:DNA-binding transcriptional LysR family regulator
MAGMNLSHLLDVKAICDAGSMRKAAALLGVTQPTLSNRIAHLEDQLGAVLFDRSRGQSQPTDLALFIASRAATIASETLNLASEIKRYAAGQDGLVRIGVGAVPARVLMGGIIGDISTTRPTLSLDVVTAHTDQLASLLLRREVDVAVCAPIEQAADTIANEFLYESEIAVIAHPDHPFCSDPPATIGDLFRSRFAISFLEPRYRLILEHEYGVDLDANPGRIFCSDWEMLLKIVMKDSRLFTAVPRFVVAREIEAGLLGVVRIPVPFRHVMHLHTNRDAHPLPAVTQVVQMVRQAFAGMRKKPA